MTREIHARNGITAEAFSPFGALIDKPAQPGQRRYYTDWLGGSGLSPVFHVNRIEPVDLPTSIGKLERHPHAAQAFVPLDISRYLVTVAPGLSDGRPDVLGMQSFIVPGSIGVIYAPGVWHAEASVLDSLGAFAVLMWRGAADDDVIAQIAPVSLVEGKLAA
mgnify:CR=1 FL=1